MNGLIIKVVLKHLTDGDTGSTYLGLLAAGLLAANINFGDFFSKDMGKKSQAIGTAIATIIVISWGYFTGKTKGTK